MILHKLLFASIILLTSMVQALTLDLDYIVAVVNEDVITRTELDRELISIIAQLRTQRAAIPTQRVLEHQILERMISKRIQLQNAERMGIKIDETVVDNELTNFAARRGLSILQLRDALKQKGMNISQFRDAIRQEILLARLQTHEVLNRISITDQEVELFLNRNKGEIAGRDAVHLQHILIATPDGASPNIIQRAREKAERILQKLRNEGAEFAQVALMSSDGRQALEGGDLGWIPLSQVPTIAAEAARTLELGAISEPIRSASGFHIFRIAEIKGGEQQIINQSHARHILIRTNELISDKEAETRLAQLRIRLTGGEPFEALARSHSDDTASAIKGGDLGWINPGDTVPVFEEQMMGLSINEVSQPFKSPFGWHLLQILGRRQHDNTSNAIKSKAIENLRKRKAEERLDLWLRQLRDEAYVEVRLDQ